MAYQVYFGDLTEENQALVLALLKFKEETESLEPGEAELLYALRGSSTPTPIPPEDQGSRHRQPGGGGRPGGGRRGGSRRGGRHSNNGGSSNGGSNGGGEPPSAN